MGKVIPFNFAERIFEKALDRLAVDNYNEHEVSNY